MDLDWSAEQAEQIARQTALPPEAFEWYQVGKEVNKAGHNGPEPIEPLKVD
jgi:putative SOS response-associated peptidase YedK